MLAGLGFNHGMLYSHYQWFAGTAMITMTFFFLPLYLKSGIFTMPEFLTRRFGKLLGTVYSGLTLFVYVVIEVPDCEKNLSLRDYAMVWEEHSLYFTEHTLPSLLAGRGFETLHRHHSLVTQ